MILRKARQVWNVMAMQKEGQPLFFNREFETAYKRNASKPHIQIPVFRKNFVLRFEIF